jgi:hypothetical protein
VKYQLGNTAAGRELIQRCGGHLRVKPVGQTRVLPRLGGQVAMPYAADEVPLIAQMHREPGSDEASRTRDPGDHLECLATLEVRVTF